MSEQTVYGIDGIDLESDASVDSFKLYNDNEREELKGPFYRTSEVAVKLNVTAQTVVNYANDYGKLLAIGRTAGGERRFTEESIKQIHFIMKDKAASGRNTQQELLYLQSTFGSYEMRYQVDTAKEIANMFMQMKESVVQEVLAGISERMEQVSIEQKEAYTAAIGMKNEMIQVTSTELQDTQAKLNATEKQLASAKESIQAKDDELSRIIQERDELRTELEKKKKRFFWKK